MITKDIELFELLFQLAGNHPELEAVKQNLSITIFRHFPPDYANNTENKNVYFDKPSETMHYERVNYFIT